MKLSPKQVEHVAELAQLALTDQEKDLFREQLSSILEYAERLQQLDTEASPPPPPSCPWKTSCATTRSSLPLPLADVLANAPDGRGWLFRVPVDPGERRMTDPAAEPSSEAQLPCCARARLSSVELTQAVLDRILALDNESRPT